MGTKRKLPFGYKMESGRIAVDTAESHWVTHLFSRYNMGVSVQELANFMNDTAVRYDPNKPWNKNMVARILGRYAVSGRKWIPGFGGRFGFLEHGGKTKEKSSCCAEDGSTDRSEKEVRIPDYTPYRARGIVSSELPYPESRANCNTTNAPRATPEAGYTEIRAGGTHRSTSGG